MLGKHQPQIGDAVLGNNIAPPISASVLGGMEGLVKRITSPNDWLNEPKRIIETTELAQQLLALLMRYFYNHCTPKPGELKMRLRYHRRIIYLSTPKDATYPETLKIYSPQYCGYLYHHGLLWGDRCGVHQEKPKQWLDKALLTLALGASKGYIIHEPLDTPEPENFLFLIVYGAYDEPARTLISSASTWKQACYSEAIYLCCVLHNDKYKYQLLNCFQWTDGKWVQVEDDSDVFPYSVSTVFHEEHKLKENKQDN